MARKYPGSEKEQAWVYDRGTWSTIEEIVFYLFDLDTEDLPDALKRAGYSTSASLHYGDVSTGMEVHVYEEEYSQNAPYPYYLDISMGMGTTEYIYTTDFPSLVMLLGNLSGILHGLIVLPEYEEWKKKKR
jgi:hypothetical protein